MSQKQNSGSQGQKFADAARELGADESEDRFNAALGKVARHKPKVAERPEENTRKKRGG